MDATLVISGASGAIGTRLIHAAAALPANITLVPLFRSVESRNAMLAACPPHLASRFRPALADITMPETLQTVARTIRDGQPVIGIHAAADVAWDKSFAEVQNVNVNGSLNFSRAIAAASPSPRLIYVSTAYTRAVGWTYRNGYEESKAAAERALRREFQGALSVFSCSLVVGCSRTGAIARHNGLYPLLRFMALAAPPFLVGRPEGLLDIVPVDWIADEILGLTRRQIKGDPPQDRVAAAGSHRIRFDQVIRLIEARVNVFRKSLGLGPTDPVPILRVRQWEFLRRALTTWQPPDIPLSDFRYFERLLQIYRDYTESDTVRPPEGIDRPSPAPEAVLPVIVDRWLSDHSELLAAKLRRSHASGKRSTRNG